MARKGSDLRDVHTGQHARTRTGGKRGSERRSNERGKSGGESSKIEKSVSLFYGPSVITVSVFSGVNSCIWL